jgi:hypothetical protein
MKKFKDEKPEAGNMCKVILSNGGVTRRYWVHDGKGELVWFPELPDNVTVIEWEVASL